VSTYKFEKAFAAWTPTDTASALAQIATTANVPANKVNLIALTSGSTILTVEVVLIERNGEALAIQTKLINIEFTGLGSYVVVSVTIISQRPSPVPIVQSNICFPGGTKVSTDQGEVAIERLKPGRHTVGGKAIKHVTRTVSGDKYLIQIEKDAFGPNKPTKATVLSKDHKIEYEGELVPAYRFLEYSALVKKVKYGGEILYNVLLEEYGTMSVNNLRCETLEPTSEIACLYRGVAYKAVKVERGRFKI